MTAAPTMNISPALMRNLRLLDRMMVGLDMQDWYILTRCYREPNTTLVEIAKECATDKQKIQTRAESICAAFPEFERYLACNRPSLKSGLPPPEPIQEPWIIDDYWSDEGSSEAGITFAGPDGERKTLRVALAALAGDMPLGAGAISLEDAE